MFIQDSLQRLRVTSVGSFPRFLIMFILVVAGPFVLFVIGGYDPSILGQAGMVWSFLAIGLLLLACIITGFLMFRRKSKAGEMSLSQPDISLQESDMNANRDHPKST